MMQAALDGTPPPPLWDPDPLGGTSPINRVYKARDRWFSVCCAAEPFWVKLALAIDRIDLLSDERFAGAPWGIAPEANRNLLREILQEEFSKRPLDEWLAILDEADVPCYPVQTRSDALTDPQILHEGIIAEIAARVANRQ